MRRGKGKWTTKKALPPLQFALEFDGGQNAPLNNFYWDGWRVWNGMWMEGIRSGPMGHAAVAVKMKAFLVEGGGGTRDGHKDLRNSKKRNSGRGKGGGGGKKLFFPFCSRFPSFLPSGRFAQSIWAFCLPRLFFAQFLGLLFQAAAHFALSSPNKKTGLFRLPEQVWEEGMDTNGDGNF
jgi:hypothetical protein